MWSNLSLMMQKPNASCRASGSALSLKHTAHCWDCLASWQMKGYGTAREQGRGSLCSCTGQWRQVHISYVVLSRVLMALAPPFVDTQPSLCLLFSCPGGKLRLREFKQLGRLFTVLLRAFDEMLFVEQTLWTVKTFLNDASDLEEGEC